MKSYHMLIDVAKIPIKVGVGTMHGQASLCLTTPICLKTLEASVRYYMVTYGV